MIIGMHGCHSGGQLVLDNLQLADTVSHLDLTLAPTPKWSNHIANLLKRAVPKAAALKKLGYRAHVRVETMSVLYKTLLRPCLEYATIFWDNSSVSDSRRPQAGVFSTVRCQSSNAPAVTGTLKHVKSSVVRSSGIVLRWSSGHGAGG